MITPTPSLKEQWAALLQENSSLRIRNAAALLQCSEAELIATQCGEIAENGQAKVTRLRPEFQAILGAIEPLGYVMALSRNDHVVHERKGVYINPTLNNPHVGLFVGEDIDLRIFFANWSSAYAVQESLKDKPRFSLQFFAKDGEAIHKIYLTATSNETAYHELVQRFASDDQSATQPTTPIIDNFTEMSDHEIDAENFREAWLKLKDTHDFFGLLKKFKLSRVQALRLAPEGNFSIKVNNDALKAVVTKAAIYETPIMVFVGNKGIIQIHTGPVKKLMDYEGWFNVLDPAFNLHVKEASIDQSWIVRKPSEDGIVTSLECFDEKGELILQLFGKRKPGIPELESWRTIIAEVETESISSVATV